MVNNRVGIGRQVARSGEKGSVCGASFGGELGLGCAALLGLNDK